MKAEKDIWQGYLNEMRHDAIEKQRKTKPTDADIKLFVTASPEVRAERRYKEFLQKGLNKTYEEVLAQIKERDERDSNRSAAPLKPAADAVIFDTSEYNAEQVFEKVCSLIDKKLEK